MARLSETAPKRPLAHSINEVVGMGAFGSRSTVYKMLNNGELEGVKVGSRTFITDASIQKKLAKLPRYQPRDAA